MKSQKKQIVNFFNSFCNIEKFLYKLSILDPSSSVYQSLQKVIDEMKLEVLPKGIHMEPVIMCISTFFDTRYLFCILRNVCKSWRHVIDKKLLSTKHASFNDHIYPFHGFLPGVLHGLKTLEFIMIDSMHLEEKNALHEILKHQYLSNITMVELNTLGKFPTEIVHMTSWNFALDVWYNEELLSEYMELQNLDVVKALQIQESKDAKYIDNALEKGYLAEEEVFQTVLQLFPNLEKISIVLKDGHSSFERVLAKLPYMTNYVNMWAVRADGDEILKMRQEKNVKPNIFVGFNFLEEFE